MNLREFARLLRARWIIIGATTILGLLVAVIVTLLATPMYQASTRLFVTTSAGGDSLSDRYSGTLDSQQRVLSYTQLIMGQNLAQRTLDKLGLNMSAGALAAEVTASAKPDTVLIDVSVVDASPVRARDIANTLSDEFVFMVKELETPADGSDPDARVVVEQKAVVPQNPVSPKKSLNIAAGSLIGLVLGVVLAFVRDYFDNTVKSWQTLELVTKHGMVGGIPLDRKRQSEPAISFEGDNSPIAESFRRLRTNLQFLAVDDPPRAIVVASSAPAEGKSTTAINIALALAEAEHNVVLVDGDMRRPMVSSYLNVVGSVGFSTVLSGATTLSNALQETNIPRLTVLASGATPPNPSELLGSLSAKKILSELRSAFDYVIIDSSPLLAVTDAAILSAAADGVLIVARFGSTKRDHLAQAVRNLEGVDASILGGVLTMIPPRGDSAYSYDYGYYGPPITEQSAQEQRRRSRRSKHAG